MSVCACVSRSLSLSFAIKCLFIEKLNHLISPRQRLCVFVCDLLRFVVIEISYMSCMLQAKETN